MERKRKSLKQSYHKIRTFIFKKCTITKKPPVNKQAGLHAVFSKSTLLSTPKNNIDKTPKRTIANICNCPCFLQTLLL